MKRKNAWLAWALAVAMLGYIVGSATVSRGAITPAPGFTSYASGTALHLDALQLGTTRVVDADLAFSASNEKSSGFTSDSLGELNHTLQPDPADHPFIGKMSSARGSGLELGLGSTIPGPAGGVLSETIAGQVAPPNNLIDVKDAGPIPINPVAYASLLHSEGAAQFTDTSVCASTAQNPLSMGRGYAADAQLIDAGSTLPDGRMGSPVLATDNPLPERSVTQTRSFTYAIKNNNNTGGPHFGLVTEIHQTYAPVQLLRGGAVPTGLVIEVLGEWVFRTIATGTSTGSGIFYGVVDPVTGAPLDPGATVIRISSDGGLTYTGLTLDSIFGSMGGLVIPPPLSGIVGLAIGEDPRAIAAPGDNPDPASSITVAPNGTVVSGAVDVIRLNALAGAAGLPLPIPSLPLPVPGVPGVGGAFSLADLRIGHFESAITVPSGGFVCPAAVTTTTSTTSSTSSTTSSTTTSTTAPATTTTTSKATTTTSKPITTTTQAPTPPAAPPATPVKVGGINLTG